MDQAIRSGYLGSTSLQETRKRTGGFERRPRERGNPTCVAPQEQTFAVRAECECILPPSAARAIQSAPIINRHTEAQFLSNRTVLAREYYALSNKVYNNNSNLISV